MEDPELLRTALESGRAAAEVHSRHLGAVLEADWAQKRPSDFVTWVDREAEARIVERIRASFPGHAILAEEGSEGTLLADATADLDSSAALGAGGPEWLWVIDPLDGTTNFLHGYPVYSASIAVLHRGEPVAAAVVDSATAGSWWASRGGGAYHDGRRIRVSEVSALERALIGTGFPFKTLGRLPEYLPQLERVLRASAGVRRAGSAALDLCHLGSGWLDGFWELSLAPWDIAAGTLVVREAGGVITTLEGDPELLGGGGVLGGNADIHAALGDLLRSAVVRPARSP